MATSSQASQLQEKIAQYAPKNFAEILDRLVGEKDNLKVEVQAVRFHVGNAAYEVSGEVNFNVKHKNNRHWVSQK